MVKSDWPMTTSASMPLRSSAYAHVEVRQRRKTRTIVIAFLVISLLRFKSYSLWLSEDSESNLNLFEILYWLVRKFL